MNLVMDPSWLQMVLSGRVDRATFWRAMFICFGILMIFNLIGLGLGLAFFGRGNVNMTVPWLVLTYVLAILLGLAPAPTVHPSLTALRLAFLIAPDALPGITTLC